MSAAAIDTSDDGGGRPWREGYDALSTNAADDAYAILEPARREEPIFYMPQYDMWCVTRHADARAIMRDWERFSTKPYSEGASTIPPEIAEKLGVSPDLCNPVFNPRTTLSSDPPQHSRLRRAYQYAFTNTATVKYEVLVRDTVDELIDRFAGDGRVEFMEHFAVPLPIMVIAKIIGLPSDRVTQFSNFFAAAFTAHAAGLTNGGDATEAWREIVAFNAYFHAFVDERRANPRDDLASEVIHAVDDDGEPLLPHEQVVISLPALATAGGETSASLLAHTVLNQRRRPDQWAAVVADRSLLPRMIEETIRFRGPVSASLRRAREEVEVGGTTIPKGALMYIALQSVNRDEEAFAGADAFDFERENAADHLGFGIGIHKCVGAALARQEVRIALDRLMDRLPNLRVPDQELALKPHLVVSRFEKLVLEWDV